MYGWTISQSLPSDGFKWTEETSQFNEDLISCNDDRDEGYFLEADVQYPENLPKFHNDLPFMSERIKKKKIKNLLQTCMIKKNILCT